MALSTYSYEGAGVVQNRLIACPLCDHEFADNEPRWKHFLDDHTPDDCVGITPIGERPASASEPLFDDPHDRLVTDGGVARNEDFWNSFDEDHTEQLREAKRYIANTPEADVVDVLATLGLDLALRDDVERLLEDIADQAVDATRVGHCQHDDIDVYGGRSTDDDGHIRHVLNTEPGERGWLGNPFVPEKYADEEHHRQHDVTVVADRETAVRRFCKTFTKAVDARPKLRRALYEDVRGGVLGGWCQRLDEDGPLCHLEVVADVADRIEKRGGDGE